MDTTRTPRKLLLVPEPVEAASDDLSAATGNATAAEAPRPRVRRYRLARLGDGGASPPNRARRRG